MRVRAVHRQRTPARRLRFRQGGVGCRQYDIRIDRINDYVLVISGRDIQEQEIDALTGALSRNHYQREMSNEVYRGGVALIDMDDLKLYNDINGHQVGDNALRALADTIYEVVGRSGSLVRYGGDEFLLLLPGVEQTAFATVLGDIQRRLRTVSIPGCEGGQHITISVGCVMAQQETIAQAACERLGWTPDFRQISWQEKDRLLADGDVDCLWGSFSMNGREDRYRWAGPYMYSRQVVIVQADSDIRTLADLNDKRIAVQTSSKPEELFLKHQVPGVEQVDSVYCFANTVDVFAALDKSYVDACAGHETAYRSFMGGRSGQYRVLDQELLRVGLGVAFYKGDDTGRAEALSDVLRELKEDGTTAGILERYGVDAQAALMSRSATSCSIRRRYLPSV